MIGASVTMNMMRYEIVSCGYDIYILGKIKEDRVRGQELRTDRELNDLYN